MKVGDLVWVNGHPRDGLRRFLAIVVRAPTQIYPGAYLVHGIVTGNRYCFHGNELEVISESR